MGLYEFKRDAKGQSFLEEVDLGYTGPKKESLTPTAVDVEIDQVKLWKCLLCDDQKFKTAGLMAKHFNSTHPEEKDSPEAWRGFHEVIYESKSG